MDRYLLDLAFLPGVALLVYVYNKDRVEKEPLGLLLLLLLGGLLSCGVAFLGETAFQNILDFIMEYGTIGYVFVEMFFGVALIEEGAKYFFLNLYTWKNKNFNCTFDGMIYAVFASLGFAIGENVLYVLSYGFEIAVARAFTAVPGHMVFSIIMGVFYSRAKMLKEHYPGSNYRLCSAMGLISATIVHGLYDFLISIDSEIAIIIWYVFVGAIFIYGFVTIRKESKNDQYI